MATLGDIAKLIRSKNAGPFYLTFDIMFADQSAYERACRSGALSKKSIARIYGTPVDQVELYHYQPALAIKFTIPRAIASCDVGDTDTHGGQQFTPLVDLPLD